MVEDEGKGGRELQELGRGKHIQNLKSQETGKGTDMDPGWQGEGPSLWLWAGSSPAGQPPRRPCRDSLHSAPLPQPEVAAGRGNPPLGEPGNQEIDEINENTRVCTEFCPNASLP